MFPLLRASQLFWIASRTTTSSALSLVPLRTRVTDLPDVAPRTPTFSASSLRLTCVLPRSCTGDERRLLGLGQEASHTREVDRVPDLSDLGPRVAHDERRGNQPRERIVDDVPAFLEQL